MVEILDLVLPDIVSIFVAVIVVMIIYNIAAMIFGWPQLTFSSLREMIER